jgi:hypothetical protein
MACATPPTIDVAIGPHPARSGWSVLRITFAQTPDHSHRIARALAALFVLEREPAAPVDEPPAASAADVWPDDPGNDDER